VHPAFTFTKGVSPTTILAGQSVLYTYTVTNTGDTTLWGLELVDDQLGTLAPPTTTLGVGESIVVTVTAQLSEDTTNVADATLYDEWEDPYTESDTAFVDVRFPAISILKSVVPETTYEGQIVTYTYLVTNTGDTTLWGLALDDDILGDLSGLLPVTMLAPGAFTTAQVTSPIYADTTNIGTITGYYGQVDSDFYGSVNDDSSAFVDIIAPELTVEKSVDKPVVLAGTEVTYTYKVTNSGDVTITALALDDDILGPITLPVSMLAPGAYTSVTADSVISVDTTNVATVTGYDPIQRPVTDSDTAFVDVVAPSLSLDKDVTPQTIAFSGMAYYTFTVTNTGDVTLYDISVDDDVIGHIGVIDELAPGASEGFADVEHMTTQDTTNTATAIGYDEWEHEASDTDTAFVDVIHPSLSVEKSVEPTVVLAGDEVVYTYVVTNTGDVDLFDLVLEDDILGMIGTRDVLTVGQKWTVTVSATIDEDTTNVAVATGYWDEEESVTGEDEAFVDVVDPQIVIHKSAWPPVVLYSGDVEYTYIVRNVGDTTLFDVMVEDDKLGTIGSGITLAPGETISLVTVAPAVDADVVNVADATGVDAWGHEVRDSDSANVDVVNPAVSLDKSVNLDVVLSGTDVLYTYIIQNTGDTTLFNLALEDDKLGPLATRDLLAAGDSWTVTAPANIVVDTSNTATVTAGYGWQYEPPSELLEFEGGTAPREPMF
ncbi:MAG: hypothetical protein Q8M66_09360, partial [Actinomycetota bacterium]|nr:hypothetical protein [Actinomycetota bacterium]